ncbi:MAG: polysaccharide biosynthesis protein PslG [Solirubrobacteraceae bacterium]|nr:polysaccharide biosynthesis protein PslG [Solirubrobacteraceae bacterium]
MTHRLRARVLSLALSVSLLLVAALFAVPAGAAAPGTVPDITWGVSHAEIDKTVGLMHDAGVQWVRTNVPWNAIEPDRKGAYNQGFLDDIDYAIQKARDAGMKVIIPVSDGVPYWASADPHKSGGSYEKTYHPRHYSDYADFFAFVVNRYKAMGVHAYEVWNEPNLKRFWASGVNAGEYAQMLRAAYPAIKAADPDSTVISGGLSGNDRGYLQQLYAHGAGHSFDVAGIHDYAWGDPSKCWQDGSGRNAEDAFCGIQEVRKVMVDHGDADKAIWITEMGWSTCQNSSSACMQSGVSRSQQASYTTKAFHILDDRYRYVKVALVYNFRNDSWLHDDPRDWEAQTGLVTTHFTPKPALRAFRDYALGKRGTRASQTPRRRTWTSIKVVRRPAPGKTGRRGALIFGHVGNTHRGLVILRFQLVRGGHWHTARMRAVHLRPDGTFAFIARRAGRHGRWRVRAEFRAGGGAQASRSAYRALRIRR